MKIVSLLFWTILISRFDVSLTHIFCFSNIVYFLLNIFIFFFRKIILIVLCIQKNLFN